MQEKDDPGANPDGRLPFQIGKWLFLSVCIALAAWLLLADAFPHLPRPQDEPRSILVGVLSVSLMQACRWLSGERAIPGVGWALLAYDVISVGACASGRMNG